MKRFIWVIAGGVLFFGTFVGLAGKQVVCAAAPYLAQCGGKHAYYIRDVKTDAAKHAFAGGRYIIERDDIRTSWGLSKDSVRNMTSASLNRLPLRGIMPYAPGTLLKTKDHWDVYVVTRGRVLRRIATPSVAALHFGSNWAHIIKEIPGSWIMHYQLGAPVLEETWFSDKELSKSADALHEATDPAWRAKDALWRDQERMDTLQEIVIPFLREIVIKEGEEAPQVTGKILLGERDGNYVWATDERNNRFRKVHVDDCARLKYGDCIPPAPDAQLNMDICGMQAPYGYQNKDSFEISFCIESASTQWVPRTDDFESKSRAVQLRPGWYKYTATGLRRI